MPVGSNGEEDQTVGMLVNLFHFDLFELQSVVKRNGKDRSNFFGGLLSPLHHSMQPHRICPRTTTFRSNEREL